MSKYVHRILDIAHHRNGISGEPFHVVRFTSPETSGEFVAIVFEEPTVCAVLNVPMLVEGNIGFAEGEFVAIVFEEPTVCAVLNVPMLVEGNIGFAEGNSWRGDNFEPELRAAIAEWETHAEERLRAIVEHFRTRKGVA